MKHFWYLVVSCIIGSCFPAATEVPITKFAGATDISPRQFYSLRNVMGPVCYMLCNVQIVIMSNHVHGYSYVQGVAWCYYDKSCVHKLNLHTIPIKLLCCFSAFPSCLLTHSALEVTRPAAVTWGYIHWAHHFIGQITSITGSPFWISTGSLWNVLWVSLWCGRGTQEG